MFLKTLLSLLAFLLVSGTVQAQSGDSLLVQLSRKWANAKVYALKMAEQMPEEAYDYRPAPEVMTFKEQLLHTADNMRWLSASFLLSGAPKAGSDKVKMNKAATIQFLSEAYDLALSAQQNLSGKQLDEVVPFFAGPLTRRQIVLLLHDHQTHHVGQVILYLRMKGIAPPAYVGW